MGKYKNFNEGDSESIIFAFICAYMYTCRLHGKLTGVYESGSSRRFKAGQTDAVRPVSSASLKFVQAMADSSTCVSQQSQ